MRRLSCSRWRRSPSPRCSAPRSREGSMRSTSGRFLIRPAGEGVPRGAGATRVIGLPATGSRPVDLDRIVAGVRWPGRNGKLGRRMITVHADLGEISAGWDDLAEQCEGIHSSDPGGFGRGGRRSGSGTPWVVENRAKVGPRPCSRSFDPRTGSTRRRTITPRALACSPRMKAAHELAAWVLERRPRRPHPRVRRSRSRGIQRLEAAAAARGYRVVTTATAGARRISSSTGRGGTTSAV